uniref:Uncharacterized protein n=1 Tax=Amphimedon queenslandica TaxID=400682 RepID=A0A1X7UNQ7_AMPQE
MEEGFYSDVINFDRCENDHHYAFEAWKRTSCFVHTLQSVVKVFESAPAFRSSVKWALDIVRKVNTSCKATEQLVELAEKKLVKNIPTRWDSLFFVICRMLEVREHLTTVLEEFEWENLNEAQWRKNLCSIETLLKPFAHHTNVTSSEMTTSIAMVVPVLKELELHLKMPILTDISIVAKSLLKELERRF